MKRESVYELKRRAARRCLGKRQYLSAVCFLSDIGFICFAALFCALAVGGTLNNANGAVTAAAVSAAAVICLLIRSLLCKLRNAAFYSVTEIKKKIENENFSLAAQFIKQLAVTAAIPFLIFPSVIVQTLFCGAEDKRKGKVFKRLKKSAAANNENMITAVKLALSELPWLILPALAALGIANVTVKLSLGGFASALLTAAGTIIISVFLEWRYSLYKASLIMLNCAAEDNKET